MAILAIIEAPHPVLSARAQPVTEAEFGTELSRFVSDLAETMYAAPGVGLAAPQVGDSRRILVANLQGDTDSESREQLVLMVNPEIVGRSKEMITWEESCLSVPEFDLDVERNLWIRVRWMDPLGVAQEGRFEQFPAVVVQHEIDHLDGVTLLDRSSRLKRIRYMAKKNKRDRG